MSFLTIERYQPKRITLKKVLIVFVLLVVPIIIFGAWAFSSEVYGAHALSEEINI